MSLRDEAGITLVEMLLSAALLLIILVPVLTTFTGFSKNVDANGRQNDAQESARNVLGGLSRQLRNVAGPAVNQPGSIDRGGPFDLIFQSVDDSGAANGANAAGVQRLRYCLGTGSSALLHMQIQRWTTAATPAMPGDTTCPGTGWTETRQVASGLSNRAKTPARPVFRYDSVDLPAVDLIRMNLFVDPDPSRRPEEVTLESGVFLRNQNRAPVAEFQATPAGLRRVVLNASAAADPEGLPLAYTWKRDGQVVGTGLLLDLSAPQGDHSITLEVQDPPGLLATQTQSVMFA